MILQACSKCGCNGVAHNNAKSFMKNMLKLAKENEKLKQEQRKRISRVLKFIEVHRKKECSTDGNCSEGEWRCHTCSLVFKINKAISNIIPRTKVRGF